MWIVDEGGQGGWRGGGGGGSGSKPFCGLDEEIAFISDPYIGQMHSSF
jgi:hypothetical protein